MFLLRNFMLSGVGLLIFGWCVVVVGKYYVRLIKLWLFEKNNNKMRNCVLICFFWLMFVIIFFCCLFVVMVFIVVVFLV